MGTGWGRGFFGGAAASAVLLVVLVGAASRRDAPETRPRKPPWSKVSPDQIAAARWLGVPFEFENDLGMRFVLIPAGTFLMGSLEDEAGRGGITVRVTLTKAFNLQTTEVTNYQLSPRERRTIRHKVGLNLNAAEKTAVWVSWQAAVSYATWLTRRGGTLEYTLPT